jgi:hypothetical protein
VKVYYFCQKDNVFGKPLLNPPVLIARDENYAFYEENFPTYAEKLVPFKEWFKDRKLNLIDFKDPSFWFTDLVRQNTGTEEKFNRHKQRIYKIWENEVADIWNYGFKIDTREIPIFMNKRAYEVLYRAFSECGEFAELSFEDQTYYLFDPIVFTSALDLNYVNLKIKLSLPSPTRFLKEKIEDKLVFVVPECPMTILFTDKFVEKFPDIESKVKGFGMKLVWDSEDPDYFDERYSDNPVESAWEYRKQEHLEYLRQKANS